MCFISDDYPEFWRVTHPTARKAHRCSECFETIAPGERYEMVAYKFDGTLGRDKSCRRCVHDRLRVVRHELDEGCDWSESWPPLGGLREAMIDAGLEPTPAADVPADFDLATATVTAVATA